MSPKPCFRRQAPSVTVPSSSGLVRGSLLHPQPPKPWTLTCGSRPWARRSGAQDQGRGRCGARCAPGPKTPAGSPGAAGARCALPGTPPAPRPRWVSADKAEQSPPRTVSALQVGRLEVEPARLRGARISHRRPFGGRLRGPATRAPAARRQLWAPTPQDQRGEERTAGPDAEAACWSGPVRRGPGGAAGPRRAPGGSHVEHL